MTATAHELNLTAVRDILIPGLAVRAKQADVLLDSVIDFLDNTVLVKAYCPRTGLADSFRITEQEIRDGSWRMSTRGRVDKIIQSVTVLP